MLLNLIGLGIIVIVEIQTLTMVGAIIMWEEALVLAIMEIPVVEWEAVLEMVATHFEGKHLF